MDDWDAKAEAFANELVGRLSGTDAMHDAVVFAFKAGAVAGIERCQEILREQASE